MENENAHKLFVPKRAAIPKSLQVQVYRRDGWMCRWCGRLVALLD